jgi:hypothetical protein
MMPEWRGPGIKYDINSIAAGSASLSGAQRAPLNKLGHRLARILGVTRFL